MLNLNAVFLLASSEPIFKSISHDRNVDDTFIHQTTPPRRIRLRSRHRRRRCCYLWRRPFHQIYVIQLYTKGSEKQPSIHTNCVWRVKNITFKFSILSVINRYNENWNQIRFETIDSRFITFLSYNVHPSQVEFSVEKKKPKKKIINIRL